MIYLIRTAMLDPREKDLTKAQPISVFKIGYTSDPEGTVRFNSYKSMGPLEVIATIQEDGPDDSLERLVHKYFNHFCIYGREWYSCEEEIVRFFSSNITGELVKAEIEKSRPELLISPETTRAELEREMIEKIELSSLTPDLKSLLLRFYEFTTFINRMKFLCETGELLGHFTETREYFLGDIVGYIEVLGPDKIKALSYQKSKLEEEFKITEIASKVDKEILIRFEVGERYKVRDIKGILEDIYSSFGYDRPCRAPRISNVFNIKNCLINDPITKKRDKGFEILSIKGEEGI